jgi:hypothetical protein
LLRDDYSKTCLTGSRRRRLRAFDHTLAPVVRESFYPKNPSAFFSSGEKKNKTKFFAEVGGDVDWFQFR